MKKSKLLTTLCALAISAGSANATVLFYDSFDYGASNININTGTVGGWTSGSGVVRYDASGGLNHPQMGVTTGGSLWLDFNDARSASNSTDFTTLNLTDLDSGGSVWMTTLFQYVSGNTAHSLSIPGGTVSNMGFSVSGAGNVSVTATFGNSVNASNATGITLTTGTYLMLARYTKGTGTSPINSAVDLWINPADASSISALGTSDWRLDSTNGQVKWGRDENILTSISNATPSQQGRIDEIRVATEFSELNMIPEPSTALLGGLGMFLLLRRRR